MGLLLMQNNDLLLARIFVKSFVYNTHRIRLYLSSLLIMRCK